MAKPKAAVLGAVDLFQSLSGRELQQVMRVADEHRFDPGDHVVNEGDEDGTFYLLLEGRAKMVEGRKTLAQLGPGDYFGEISLLDGEPRTAAVVATTPVRMISLGRWAFRPLLEDQPALARKLLLEMCRRVRELDHSPDH